MPAHEMIQESLLPEERHELLNRILQLKGVVSN